MKKHWIAIDWGTTNFRAFLLNEQQVIASVAQPCGLLTLSKDAFAATLHQHLAPWLTALGALPIVMAGMVGSQQGWQEVLYVAAQALDIPLRTADGDTCFLRGMTAFYAQLPETHA